MLDCRRCKNWVDEGFAQLFEEKQTGHAADSVYYGCKLFGFLESCLRDECAQYQESPELYALCNSCGIAVPKVCISLGECVNCTDTDLFCVEHCQGEKEKRYCTHFQRLLRDGHTLIEENECFELYPKPQQEAGKPKPEAPSLLIMPDRKPPTGE